MEAPSKPVAPPVVPATDAGIRDGSPRIEPWGLVTSFARCQSCGRGLTDDTSRARGYGPDCWRAQHPQRRRRRTALVAMARVPTGPVPGQTEIDLTDEEHAD